MGLSERIVLGWLEALVSDIQGWFTACGQCGCRRCARGRRCRGPVGAGAIKVRQKVPGPVEKAGACAGYCAVFGTGALMEGAHPRFDWGHAMNRISLKRTSLLPSTHSQITRRTRALLAAVVTFAALCGVSTASASPGPGLDLPGLLTPKGAHVLYGVAMVSSSDVWAVGVGYDYNT